MSYSGSAGGGIGGVSPASTPQVAAVPGTKILLCKSGVKDKKPDPAGAEYGEVFVNYHSGSPMLCFKDNAGEIVEIKPTRNIDGGGGETPPNTGNEIGDTLWDGTHFRVWDGSTWVAVGPNDLAYVQKVDGGTITNSAGSDVDIPVVNNIQAGLMLPGDKNKLDTYPADSADLSLDLQAVTDNGNTTTNPINGVQYKAGTTTSAASASTGAQVTDKAVEVFTNVDDYDLTNQNSRKPFRLLAGDTDANAKTPRWFVDGDGSTWQGEELRVGGDLGSPNISLNADGSAEFAGNVECNGEWADDGNPRVRIAGNVNNAVVQIKNSTANKDNPALAVYQDGNQNTDTVAEIRHDGSAFFAGNVSTTNGGVSATRDIQKDDESLFFAADSSSGAKFSVTRQGTYIGDNITGAFQNANIELLNNGSASFGAGNIEFNADGSANFKGVLQLEGNPYQGGEVGAALVSPGKVMVCRTSGTTFESYTQGNATPTVEINADGSARFVRDVRSDGQVLASNNTQYALLDSRGYVNIRKDDISNTAALKIFKGGSGTANEQIVLNNDGSAHFKGNVTSDGTIGFNLEPDNEANYTVTTSTDEEGNEVENRVYNGPTLNVKEALLSLQQKVNDRDAVIASLTTRIAALEAQAA